MRSLKVGIVGVLCVALMSLVMGCATMPEGGTKNISAETQVALEVAVKIAVRHALDANPRAGEKAANIRAIAVQLQTVVNAESTLVALNDLVKGEIEKLDLNAVDKADALDLLQLFSAALEARLGNVALNSAGVVKVNQFLTLLISTLPKS